MKAIKIVLWLLVLASLVPALILAIARHQAEMESRVVTLLIDGQGLYEQAGMLGMSPFELAERYRSLGLNGIALYEDTLETLNEKGKVAMLAGYEAHNLTAIRGEALPQVEPSGTLVAELEPAALQSLLEKTAPIPERISFAGRDWWRFAGNVSERPAGPDRAQVTAWHEAGWDIAYRPHNHPSLVSVGQDFPPEANYLIHTATEVAGQPDLLGELVENSQNYVTGLIEGTVQDGMHRVIPNVPASRVFSINQDWLETLRPEEVADKYLLAANERGARLLYLRPYARSKVGNPFENTELLVKLLASGLARNGFHIGEVQALDYRSDILLRPLSATGILASLGLLALMYPGFWGPLIALGVLALGLMAGGMSFGALALVAALCFPVIGYGLLPERLTTLGLATLISLAGAVLLAAVGAERATMLAAEPFAGVAATLIVPPLLFLSHFAMRYGHPGDLLVKFWNRPIRLGDAAVACLALLALAVVFLRRGNFPLIGVSSLELAFRDSLAQWFAIRPRFKELIGHPAGVLGLMGGELPVWFKGLLLTGGVIAQASILNSFSHYHSPLLISLARSLIALAIGLALGLALLPLLRLALRRWFKRGRSVERDKSGYRTAFEDRG